MINVRHLKPFAAWLIAPLAAMSLAGPGPALAQTTTQGVSTRIDAQLHVGLNGVNADDRASANGRASAQTPDGAIAISRDLGRDDGRSLGGTSVRAHASFSEIGLVGSVTTLASGDATGASASAFYSATGSISDMVTIVPTETLLAGSVVTWEGRLTFDGAFSTRPVQTDILEPGAGEHAGAGVLSFVTISGTGLSACPYPDIVFGEQGGVCGASNHSTNIFGNGDVVSANLDDAPISELIWRLDMIVGMPTAIDLKMVLKGDAFADVTQHATASGGLVSDFSHTLRWDGRATFRDASGALLPDAVLKSVSGFDYAHPDSLGVPEPATWAILLAGFGAVGVALRRRRLALA